SAVPDTPKTPIAGQFAVVGTFALFYARGDWGCRILGNPGNPLRPEPQGREAVFAELYSAHFRPLVAFCRRQLGAGGDPEAFAQEAFLRAWASWDRYAPTRPFWPWVSTIARRLCIDHGRRQRRAAARGARPVEDVPPPEPDEAVLALDEYAWARRALAALQPHQQRVLHLREVDGWSYDRIASHEGISVESVRGSLKRSRQALRAAYTSLAEWNPVVVAVAAVRGLARRLSEQAQRTHMAVAVSGMGDRAVNVLAVAVVVGLGASGGGDLPARPPLPTAAAAAAAPKAERPSGVPAADTQARPHGDVSPPHGAGVRRTSASAASGPATSTPPDNGLRVPGSGG
ncbi:MAG TPA: sigma-70 family RNA polymerase sigma factor, partial [Solirubrobacteraceae bacterium]|nr:sigma-70 family RNA polymerase sigma factor [Solirubrobacteraceae bacterium]